MSQRYGLTAATTALAVLLFSPVAHAGGLDQSFEADRNDGAFRSSIQHGTGFEAQVAQTFTVGLDGTLARVEVYIEGVNQDAGPLILEIQALSSGVPDGTVLASTSLDRSSVPDTDSYVSFDLSGAALAVSVGDELGIVLRCDELPVPGPQWYNWLGESGAEATYDRGKGYAKTNADPWTDFGLSFDYGFRTYVGAPVPTLDSSWGVIKSEYQGR